MQRIKRKTNSLGLTLNTEKMNMKRRKKTQIATSNLKFQAMILYLKLTSQRSAQRDSRKVEGSVGTEKTSKQATSLSIKRCLVSIMNQTLSINTMKEGTALE